MIPHFNATSNRCGRTDWTSPGHHADLGSGDGSPPAGPRACGKLARPPSSILTTWIANLPLLITICQQRLNFVAIPAKVIKNRPIDPVPMKTFCNPSPRRIFRHRGSMAKTKQTTNSGDDGGGRRVETSMCMYSQSMAIMHTVNVIHHKIRPHESTSEI
jgi:hypothetical protein